MTKRKPGRPRTLPVESSHWISYAAALEEATERFRSEELAIQKLDDALASGTIGCKIESLRAKPKVVKSDDRVTVAHFPTEEREPWVDPLTIYLNGEPRSGWLFLWNCGLNKYFRGATAAIAAAEAKTPKTAAAVGHPLRFDWVEIVLFVERLRRNSRGITRNGVVRELQQRLPREGVKLPENTELQAVVKQIFSFDERHPFRPK